jgi:hypothetical protein
MKKIILFTFLCGISFGIFSQQPGVPLDVQHYTFAVILNDDNNSIQGKATIEALLLKECNNRYV